MVSQQSIQAQLGRLGFNTSTWGKTEVDELQNIIIPEEIIYECVNGIYEAGFSLLVATNFRVLLVDKKPLNYLTVVDLRFDMINEIEYSHRLFVAQITISTGSKTLRFRSYNQQRLRKLIDHVQSRMAEAKHRQSLTEEGQYEHLGIINQQLQTYLMAQYQTQQEISQQLQQAQLRGYRVGSKPKPLLSKPQLPVELGKSLAPPALTQDEAVKAVTDSDDLRSEGIREVFGKHVQSLSDKITNLDYVKLPTFDVNTFRIAYSKLPMILRNRKFYQSINPKLPIDIGLNVSHHSTTYLH